MNLHSNRISIHSKLSLFLICLTSKVLIKRIGTFFLYLIAASSVGATFTSTDHEHDLMYSFFLS